MGDRRGILDVAAELPERSAELARLAANQRAWAEVAAKRPRDSDGVGDGVDLTVFLDEISKATPKVAGMMRCIGMGATTTRSRRHRAGYEDSSLCLLCGEADEDEEHRDWHCSRSFLARLRHGLVGQA